jgi:hypothetical protein
VTLVAQAWLGGCVHAPPRPAPGTGTLWGYVRLVPRAGVKPGKASDGAYADRRLRDVEFVDYSKPGFVVVHLEGGMTPRGTDRVTIEPSTAGPSLAPSFTVVGVDGTVVLKNADRSPHTVASPELGLLRRLEAGSELALRAGSGGAARIHLLDAPGTQALVYVSPGPYAVASADGRWELRDVPPGKRTIRAWHPRFPATVREVTIPPGEVRQVDLDIGVHNLDVEH